MILNKKRYKKRKQRKQEPNQNMVVTCQIRFNDENAQQYFSGDEISGEIILEALCGLTIKEIYIKLEGKLYIEWKELESKNKQNVGQYYLESYKNEETFLTISQTLLKNILIKDGKYVNPFNIKLPESIPSTCSINSSYIQYEFSVIFQDVISSLKLQMIPLTIRRNMKFLSQTELNKPVMNNLEICSYCNCHSQPFTASVMLHTSIYAPGSDLEYTIQLDNPNEYFDIKNISVTLFQYIQYTSKVPIEKQRCDTVTVVSNSHDNPCTVPSPTNTLTDALKLPKTLTNTSIDHCAIIISYRLQIHIDMGNSQRSGDLNIPITIDTCTAVLEEAVSPTSITETKIFEDETDNSISETLKDTDTLKIEV